jgi:hypothetical protein
MAGAFHPDRRDRAEPLSPGGQLRIATRGRSECSGLLQPPTGVQRRCYVHIGMGVHPDRHKRSIVHRVTPLVGDLHGDQVDNGSDNTGTRDEPPSS